MTASGNQAFTARAGWWTNSSQVFSRHWSGGFWEFLNIPPILVVWWAEASISFAVGGVSSNGGAGPLQVLKVTTLMQTPSVFVGIRHQRHPRIGRILHIGWTNTNLVEECPSSSLTHPYSGWTRGVTWMKTNLLKKTKKTNLQIYKILKCESVGNAVFCNLVARKWLTTNLSSLEIVQWVLQIKKKLLTFGRIFTFTTEFVPLRDKARLT